MGGRGTGRDDQLQVVSLFAKKKTFRCRHWCCVSKRFLFFGLEMAAFQIQPRGLFLDDDPHGVAINPLLRWLLRDLFLIAPRTPPPAQYMPNPPQKSGPHESSSSPTVGTKCVASVLRRANMGAGCTVLYDPLPVIIPCETHPPWVDANPDKSLRRGRRSVARDRRPRYT